MNYEDLSPSRALLAAINYIDYHGDDVMDLSDDDYQKRMDICSGCEHYIETFVHEDSDEKELVHACKECGCILEDKCRDIMSSCPIKKWGQQLDTWDGEFYPNMLEYFKKNGIDPEEW